MNDKNFQEYRRKALKYYDKKQKKHVLKVEEISLMLCDIADVNDEKDRQAVSLAALLHDVGKSKKHNKVAADFVLGKSFLKKNSFLSKKIVIAHMIQYHRGNSNYKELEPEVRKLISIVRLADKISKVYKIKKTKKIAKTLDETMEDIAKLMEYK